MTGKLHQSPVKVRNSDASESAPQLLHLGKNYPKGFDFFRERLKASFMKHRDVTDPAHIEQLLLKAEYVTKELEALYMLRKYRTMKRRYYDEQPGPGASS